MDARKAELERKRAKLAELRAARESRRKALEIAQTKDIPSGKADVEDFVNKLVGGRANAAVPSSSGPPSNTSGSRPGSALGDSPSGEGGARRHENHRLSTTSTMSDFSDHLGSPSAMMMGGARTIPEFSAVDAVIFDIPPKEKIMYSKDSQTMEDFWERPDPEDAEREIQARIDAEIEREAEERRLAEEHDRLRKQAEEAAAIRELSEEEAEALIRSEHFIEFVDHSAKLVERALNEEYDFLIDYTIAQDFDAEVNSGSRVKLLVDFYEDRLCRNRSIMDIAWSPKHPELCVAAYNKNPMAFDAPDGLVLIWNTHLRERPEFTFHAPSDVLTAQFSPFHPNLVIGGTYAGQVLLWDTRARSLPVLKTPLSSVGHTHPIYSIDVVGTQNAHNLISASTDGLVCSWQLDMLAQPQETLELLHQSHPRTDEVAITALAFPENETTAFWAGTEEGAVYQANRYDRAGNKAGLNQYDAYRGHHGSITGLHFHPLVGPIDFSDLFLTSSVDWTVKLWRAKSVAKPSTAPNPISPTYSFEVADDYVYDVAWSPVHPALFASVDGTGRLDLWNLNQDTEVPVISTLVGASSDFPEGASGPAAASTTSGAPTPSSSGANAPSASGPNAAPADDPSSIPPPSPMGLGRAARALNKLAWDKEGRRIATGGLASHVWVYDVGELAVPRPEEWTTFQRTVAEMTATKEREEAH